MRLLAWIVVVAAADFVAFAVTVITGVEENCNNGISRWECSTFLRDTSPVVFFALLGLLVFLLVVGLLRVIAARRPSK